MQSGTRRVGVHKGGGVPFGQNSSGPDLAPVEYCRLPDIPPVKPLGIGRWESLVASSGFCYRVPAFPTGAYRRYEGTATAVVSVLLR